MSLRHKLGIDAPVAYVFLGRIANIVGSTGTVLLIARTLTPVEQGYYYTLLSLVALQIVFELGFSFVIQQLAAHESVHLRFGKHGAMDGTTSAQARLASVLRLSMRWYTVAAVGMVVLIAPLGSLFFAHHAAEHVQVDWRGPWLCAICASAFSLWCMPFYAFLEGCGQVRAVAALRLRQALASTALAWTALLLHHGLYAPALVIAAQIAVGLLFLFGNRRLLLALLRVPLQDNAVRWRADVWPFQWRIAISWMCTYFTMQVFVPILFALRGAVEAGQMGMSLSITGYMTVLALSWTSTKATPFGNLIARGELHALDQLFQRSMRQSLGAFAALACTVCLGAAALPAFAPHLAARMLPAHLLAVLALGAGANCAVQCMATLLRSFKREPFLVLSLAAAAVTLSLGSLAATRWGTAGAVFSYLTAMGGVALPSAWTILRRERRSYLARIAATGKANQYPHALPIDWESETAPFLTPEEVQPQI
ncbi:MAG TPA: hypothetical protein VG893_00665 [Terracidiphilus sp.]|nr:hypothetical protein [Terracidiphilus sp.]